MTHTPAEGAGAVETVIHGCQCRHDTWYDPKCPCCNRRPPAAAERGSVSDEYAAIRLLEEALHLRINGERAPGGNETWRDWDRRAERFLQERLERARLETRDEKMPS